MDSINFEQKFAAFSARWEPKVIAEMNDYQFKLVRLAGDFVWHDHPETDEAFIVLDGSLRIDFRDGNVPSMRVRCSSSPRGWSTNLSPRMSVTS